VPSPPALSYCAYRADAPTLRRRRAFAHPSSHPITRVTRCIVRPFPDLLFGKPRRSAPALHLDPAPTAHSVGLLSRACAQDSCR